MSVGILLITHCGVGHALITTLHNTFGQPPIPIRALSIDKDPDLEHFSVLAGNFIQELDQGQGVLVLTDMFGATPSNIALRLQDDYPVRVVAGLNLPMLFKIMNYPDLPLKNLSVKAVQGGKEGIVESKSDAARLRHDQVALQASVKKSGSNAQSVKKT